MKDFFTRPKLRLFAIDTAYYSVGSILMALGIYTFAKNANFAPGGISGVALMVNHFTEWPIGLVTLALNVPLVLVCGKVLGLGFLGKSTYAMLINTLFMDVVFPLFPTYTGDPLLAAMFTGVCGGAGAAIIYMRGSSTGGTDFITMTVKKLRPHFKVGQISLVFDAAVILAGGIVFGNIDAVLYGIVSSFAGTIMTDNILYGAGSGKMAIIITSCGQAIADAISAETGRGSTLVKAIGSYSGKPRDMLLCVCSKNEIYKVRMAARALDPGSMVMISEASEVFGEGFVPPNLPGNEDPPPAETPDEAGAQNPGGK